MQEVVETLKKVLEIVDGQGACWSSTAPPAVHWSVTCPRVTVRLRSTPPPSRSFSISRMQPSRGQRYAAKCFPSCLCLSTQHFACTVPFLRDICTRCALPEEATDAFLAENASDKIFTCRDLLC